MRNRRALPISQKDSLTVQPGWYGPDSWAGQGAGCLTLRNSDFHLLPLFRPGDPLLPLLVLPKELPNSVSGV